MPQDSKAYLHFFLGIGIGASGAMLHQYVAFAAVIISLIAFIWSCLDAQDDKKDDDQKTAEKATQFPELFTKYQKILNEEDETKLRESFSFSAKDIAKFNRLFQPEKYPYPAESEFSEEQDDIVVPIHINKAWNPYKKRQSLCPPSTSRDYLPIRRSSVPATAPFIVVHGGGGGGDGGQVDMTKQEQQRAVLNSATNSSSSNNSNSNSNPKGGPRSPQPQPPPAKTFTENEKRSSKRNDATLTMV